MKKLPLFIVDDEGPDGPFVQSWIDLLTGEGYSCEVYRSVEEARAPLLDFKAPFIVLIDHDLGQNREPGYKLLDDLRRQHPWGCSLPIVYMTGKISANAFYSTFAQEIPYSPPAAFFQKESNPDRLLEFLELVETQFADREAAFAEQNLQRALLLDYGAQEEKDNDEDDNE